MIYLIEDRDYLKIGYTKNLEDRLKSYKLHNPYAKLIASKDGNKKDEDNLMELCSKYNYQGEWFHNVDEVKTIFNNYKTTMFDGFDTVKKIIDRFWISNAEYFSSDVLIDDLSFMIRIKNISHTEYAFISTFWNGLKNTSLDGELFKYKIIWEEYTYIIKSNLDEPWLRYICIINIMNKYYKQFYQGVEFNVACKSAKDYIQSKCDTRINNYIEEIVKIETQVKKLKESQNEYIEECELHCKYNLDHLDRVIKNITEFE